MTAIDEIEKLATGLGCAVLRDAPMSGYTTFKIGGPASVFVKPDSAANAALLISSCESLGLKLLILGSGSNIVVSDNGFAGMVLCTSELNSCAYTGDGIIECGAGVRLSAICKFALEHALTGLEFAYGIPGSAGGSAYMNAGAYNGEMKNVLLECSHIAKGAVTGTLKAEELDMSYRHSAYSANGYLITGLKLQLKAGIKRSIEAEMNDIMIRRRDKQPLDLPSAGSVFKKPADHYAGQLIESCKLKGFSVGGAMVSRKHAGFIVNTGHATSADVYKLVELIREKVYRETSILLETEIQFIQ